MFLSLLERVKQKALDALNGAGQAVGGAVQNFEHNFTQPSPQIPQQNSQPPIDFGAILRNVASYIGNQPLIQQPPLIQTPIKSPTVGDAWNKVIVPALQAIPRSGFEAAQSIAGDNRAYDPSKMPAGNFFFGDQPLRNFSDPNRPARQFARSVGHPELTGPLALTGAVLSDIPFVGAEKTALTESLNLAKSAKTVDEFATVLKAAKPEVQNVVTKVLQDAKVPINTIEDFFNAAKTAPKATQDLINAAKAAKEAPKVNPFASGDVYAPKGTAQKLFEDTFRSAKGVIAKAGPAGQEIVNRLNRSAQDAATLAGQATNTLQQAFKTLNKNEISTFADVVEGKAQPLSDAQASVVKLWNGIAADVASKAKAVGIDMGIRPNYFPHQILELTKADKISMAQEMVNKGLFKTTAEAMQSLEKEVSALSRGAQRRFGNLELPRTSFLPYNKSPNALFNYVQGAYGRIADATHFGKADEQLYKLAQAAGTQGGDSNQIVKYLDQILGKNQGTSNIARKLTSFQTITKLNPITSAVNLTQNLSTWLRTDTGTMLATMKNIIANPTAAFANATKVGEITPNMAKLLEDYTGSSGNLATKWIRLIGMQGTEKFNRVVAVNAGIEYGQKLAKQALTGSEAAIRELQRFGIGLNDIKNGVLSDNALLKIGRQISGETQFSTKAGELPYYWRTNLGKVITQFKSFAYKQTGFLKNEVGRIGSEASQGNIKPLINSLIVFGVSAPIAGEVVNDFRSLIRNKKRDDVGSLTQRYISNILAATSFGLLDSTGALFGQFGGGGIISTVGGPTVSDVQKGVTAVADAAKGATNYDPNKTVLQNLDPANTTQRAVLKEIPAVGQTVSNTVVPNSYVQNQTIGDTTLGVNNGLNKADNVKYNEMKQIDPTAAEKFKNDNQQAQKPSTGKFLGLFGGGTPAWDKVPTSKKEQSAYNDLVDTSLANGAKVPDKALVQRFFDGQTYDPQDISKSKKIFTSMEKVANDQYLTPEQKASIANAAGIPSADLNYYRLASMDAQERLQGLLAYAQGDHPDRNQFISSLVLNKRDVGGKAIMDNTMILNLYDQGYITKDEKKLLDAIKYDQIYGKFYVGRDYAIANSGGMTPAQVKALITKVNTINKVNLKLPTQKKLTFPKTKAPKAPKLNLTMKQKAKSKTQWFTA